MKAITFQIPNNKNSMPKQKHELIHWDSRTPRHHVKSQFIFLTPWDWLQSSMLDRECERNSFQSHLWKTPQISSDFHMHNAALSPLGQEPAPVTILGITLLPIIELWCSDKQYSTHTHTEITTLALDALLYSWSSEEPSLPVDII